MNSHQPPTRVDGRTVWIATCMFWAWSWAVGSIVWAPFTFGLSLLGLLLAGGSVWAMWIPIGVPQQPQPWPAQYTRPAPPTVH